MLLELFVVAALVLAIPALFLGVVRHAYSHEVADDLAAWGARMLKREPLALTWYALAGLIGLIVLVIALNSLHHPRGEAGVFVLLGTLAVLGLFFHTWKREFLFLMSRRDDEFPGRFDKLSWTLMLTLLPPVGLWFFHAYRMARWPVAKPERVHGEAAPELS